MITSGGLVCLEQLKLDPLVVYCLRCFRRLRYPSFSNSIITLPPHASHYFCQLISQPFHTMNRKYSVFLSHAGPDKESIAIPLYERLRERNIHAFLDREELRVGDNGPRVMEYAMNTAPVGVFSPEFAAKRNILFFIQLYGSLRPLPNKVKALTNIIRTTRNKTSTARPRKTT